MNELLYKDEVYAIQGAIYEVYKILGNGYKEEVYQQCLERELNLRSIPFDSKMEVDFLCGCYRASARGEPGTLLAMILRTWNKPLGSSSRAPQPFRVTRR